MKINIKMDDKELIKYLLWKHKDYIDKRIDEAIEEHLKGVIKYEKKI